MNQQGTARLQYVLGRTAVGPNSIATCERSRILAYIAGSTVVLVSLDSRREGHVLCPANLSCLSLSNCGGYLATGETGSSPSVRIFEISVQDGRPTAHPVHELKHHTSDVTAIRFSPDSSILVTVGCPSDGQICVWDWQNAKALGTAKLAAQVNCIAFSPDGSTCVTSGAKHVKYWAVTGIEPARGIQSRSAILADRRSSIFVDCVFLDQQRLLAVTNDGAVVELANKKYVNTYQWEDLSPTCIGLTDDSVLLGCSSGAVHLCSRVDLSPMTSLPLPAPVGSDPAMATTIGELQHMANESRRFPSVRCLSTLPSSGGVVSIHSDNSLYLHSPSQDGTWQRLDSRMAHAGSINTVMVYPSNCSQLPSGSYLTGGSDGTVRIWNAEGEIKGTNSVPSTNLLSSTLKKVIHIADPHLEPSSSQEDCVGVLSLSVSTDGRHLVAGTSAGTLHVVDLADSAMPTLEVIDAHESGVLCLEYSDERYGISLLASGGQDRLVHVFSTSTTPYVHCQVIEDHQGSIKAIRFAQVGESLQLFTCSSDNTMVVWRLHEAADSIEFTRLTQVVCPSPFNDLVLSKGGQTLLAACQDGQLRTYGLDGKMISSVTAAVTEAYITSACLDPSGSLAVSSHSDGSVQVLDVKGGQLVAAMEGTGGGAVRAVVAENCKRLVVASTNGCVYVWRFSNALVERMLETKREMLMARSPSPDSLLDSESEATSDYLLSSLNDFGRPDFGSSGSLEKPTATPTVLTSTTKRSALLTVLPAAVHRRSNSNLLSVTDGGIEDISDQDSQSDFVSRQRPLAQYQTSKSMLNLREMQANGMMTGSPLRPVAERQTRRVRPGWGEYQPPMDNDWKPPLSQSPAAQPFSQLNGHFTASPVRVSPLRDDFQTTPHRPPPMQSFIHSNSPTNQRLAPQYQRGNTEGFPLTPQRLDQSPSRSGLSQLQALSRSINQPAPVGSSPFRRDSGPRVSLSKKYMEGAEPRTVWTPQAMNPRRTTSNLQTSAPTGAAASAITRRRRSESELFRVRFGVAARKDTVPSIEVTREEPKQNLRETPREKPRARTQVIGERDIERAKAARAEDYTSSQLHLRSRSQSPNQILMRQQATPTGRDLTKDLQRRRDSDMSYTAVSSRMTPATSRSNLRDGETRKSTDALNKMAAIRSKLHQSSENLRKSSDNLAMTSDSMTSSSTMGGRTRSISNLRGAQLETAGTFDADSRPRIPGSLAHSRMLARSMGNVSNADDGGISMPETAGARLQNTLAMLKKASNSDLTYTDQFEDPGSPMGEKMRRRGAVQKKVERYHPRNNRSNRPQTSEESDSNASDASPLNQSINRRIGAAAGYRSVSSVESSVRAGPGMASRRLYEQQRTGNVASPRRTNYLAQKLAGEDMQGGPDLGSDESPRSSVNASEWNNLLDDTSDCQQLVKHVQDCSDQFQVHTDKLIHARKMVEDSSLTFDQKRIVVSQIDRVAAVSADKLSGARTRDMADSNGNDYSPNKGTQMYQLKQNLSFKH